MYTNHTINSKMSLQEIIGPEMEAILAQKRTNKFGVLIQNLGEENIYTSYLLHEEVARATIAPGKEIFVSIKYLGEYFLNPDGEEIEIGLQFF